MQTSGASKNSVMDVGGTQNVNFVKWNPKAGLDTTEKHIESPAKVLEHEFAHAVTEAKSSDLHQYNVDTARGSDKPYDTKDDRRKKQS